VEDIMLNRRTWIAIIILGFLGQLAWGVENQFFNTFVYSTITPDPRPVSWMVAASAVVATFASVFMGAFSDRIRPRWGRKPFLLIGYLLWGITTAIFPTAAFFHSIGLAIFMAILFDCIMTFFGSSSNDSVFNAYIADITTVENRGKVVGVLEILTWVALLFVYGGAEIVIKALGYYAFFYILGGLVFVLSLVANLLLKEPPLPKEAPKGSYWSQIADTFRWSSLKKQRDLLFLFISITLWGIAQNIFFPYLMIYINTYLNIQPLQASLIVFFAILLGGIATAYPFGLLTDRWGRKNVALVAVVGEMIGLIAFSLARSLPALIITGILWLAPISAWTVSTGAWSKDLFPEDKRGQFAGYVILFSVALTMVPGPILGSWLITTFGIPTVIAGKAGFIPTSLIFQVGGVATLLALIPLLRIGKKKLTASK
jgi:MFS family permease